MRQNKLHEILCDILYNTKNNKARKQNMIIRVYFKNYHIFFWTICVYKALK